MRHSFAPFATLLLAGLLTCAGLAGCAVWAEEDEPVVITLWHQKIGAERVFFNEALAAYNAKHDDHEVRALYRETEEMRNLFVIASVGGKGPDVIFGPADNVGTFAVTETIQPIDDVLSEDYLDNFTDAGVVSWEGEPWMVADQVGNHLMYVYNQDLISEPPRTMEELVDVLQRTTEDTDGDGNPDQYGLTWNYREPFFFIPFLTCYGGWVMNEEGEPTLDTEATVKAIEFILDLRDRYDVIPDESDYDTAEALFKDERAASIINGPWAWSGYGDAGVDYGLARIPKMSETGRWCAPMFSAKGYSVNVNVGKEKMPYVREFLRHFTGAEMQRRMAQELATIPVIESVRNSDIVKNSKHLRASIRQLEVARPMPIDPRMRQIWDGMRGPYQLVMNGAVTPEEGAHMMQEKTEELIEDTFL